MALTGPSRTIVVEPVRLPETAPAPARGDPTTAPPSVPEPAPTRENEPVPA